MDIFKFNNPKKESKDNISEIIQKIREGDSLLRKQFIDDYQNFILKTVLHTLGKSSLPKNSPEFDIAVSAFSFSIDNYDTTSKNNFLLFSEQKIKEWIFSYIRDDSSNSSSIHANEEKNYLYYTYETKEEIVSLKKRLWEFGIKLSELPRLTPDDKHSISFCLRAAKVITKNQILLEKLIEKKDIPIDELDDVIKANKKIISKYKKYVIALTFILVSNLKILNSYLKNVETHYDKNENMGVILEICDEESLLFTSDGKFILLKYSKGRKVGEQIQFGSYRIKNAKFSGHLYIAGAGVVALTFVTLYVVFSFVNMLSSNVAQLNSSKETVTHVGTNSEGNIAVQVPSSPLQSKEPVEKDPSSTLTSAVVEPDSTDLPAAAPSNAQKTTPKPTSTAKPSPDKTKNPSTESMKPTGGPTEKPSIAQANGVPDEVRISVHPAKIKVGDKYEVHMYMKSGNNGTTLILYENNIEIERFDLKDRTPGAQAKIVDLKAKKAGINSYHWELVNSFGSSNSKTINVKISDDNS